MPYQTMSDILSRPRGISSAQRAWQYGSNESEEQQLPDNPTPWTQPVASYTPEKSLASHAKDVGWSTLGAVGNFFDVPGSMVRDVAAIPSALWGSNDANVDYNPLNQLLPWNWFDAEGRTDGRELNRAYGLAGDEDGWGNLGGGIATEILLDPLTYLSLGTSAATKGGRSLYKVAKPKDVSATATKMAKEQIGRERPVSTWTAQQLVTPRQVLADAADPAAAREAYDAAARKGWFGNTKEVSDEAIEGMLDERVGGFAKWSYPLPESMREGLLKDRYFGGFDSEISDLSKYGRASDIASEMGDAARAESQVPPAADEVVPPVDLSQPVSPPSSPMGDGSMEWDRHSSPGGSMSDPYSGPPLYQTGDASGMNRADAVAAAKRYKLRATGKNDEIIARVKEHEVSASEMPYADLVDSPGDLRTAYNEIAKLHDDVYSSYDNMQTSSDKISPGVVKIDNRWAYTDELGNATKDKLSKSDREYTKQYDIADKAYEKNKEKLISKFTDDSLDDKARVALYLNLDEMSAKKSDTSFFDEYPELEDMLGDDFHNTLKDVIDRETEAPTVAGAATPSVSGRAAVESNPTASVARDWSGSPKMESFVKALEGRGAKYVGFEDESGAIVQAGGGGGSTSYPTFVMDNGVQFSFTQSKTVPVYNEERRAVFLRDRPIDPDVVTFEAIVAPDGVRGGVQANSAMRRLTEAADESGVTLRGEVAPMKNVSGGVGLDSERLQRWYEKFGFGPEDKRPGNPIIVRRPKELTQPTTPVADASDAASQVAEAAAQATGETPLLPIRSTDAVDYNAAAPAIDADAVPTNVADDVADAAPTAMADDITDTLDPSADAPVIKESQDAVNTVVDQLPPESKALLEQERSRLEESLALGLKTSKYTKEQADVALNFLVQIAKSWATKAEGRQPHQLLEMYKITADKPFSEFRDRAAKSIDDAGNPKTLYQGSPRVPGDPSLDGFYSKLARVTDEKVGGKTTWSQYKATLTKAGVKQEEIEDIGLESFFADGKPKTKAEIQKHLDDNRIEIEVVQQGNVKDNLPREDYARASSEAGRIVESANIAARENTSRVRNEVLAENPNPLGLEVTWMGHDTKRAYLRAAGNREVGSVWVGDADMNRSEILKKYYESNENWMNSVSDPRFDKLRDENRKLISDANNQYTELLKPFDGMDFEGKPSLFSSYQVPGGDKKTYREILVRKPPKADAAKQRRLDELVRIQSDPNATVSQRSDAMSEAMDINRQVRQGAYNGPHFNQSNIAVHLRVDDITLPNGKKELRVQEVQSDWHQDGRKHGYAPTESELKQAERRAKEIQFKTASSPEEAEALRRESEQLGRLLSRGTREEMVPDGPFKKSWHMLGLKQILKMAAEEGYESVSIVRGADAARSVGGPPEALGTFYDKIVAGDLKKYTKRWGSFLGETNVPQSTVDADLFWGSVLQGSRDSEPAYTRLLDTNGHMLGLVEILPDGRARTKGIGDDMEFGSVEEAKQHLVNLHGDKIFTGDVKVFKITDKMRKDLLEEGQPLYQNSDLPGAPKGAAELFEDVASNLHFFEGADFSTLVHEISHPLIKHMSPDIRAAADAHYGVPEGMQWSRDHMEAFADDFERYMSEGVAPKNASKELVGMFQKAKEWMLQIYRSVVGSPLEDKLHPEARRILDSMMTPDVVPPKGSVVDELKTGESIVNPVAPRTDIDPSVIPSRVDDAASQSVPPAGSQPVDSAIPPRTADDAAEAVDPATTDVDAINSSTVAKEMDDPALNEFDASLNGTRDGAAGSQASPMKEFFRQANSKYGVNTTRDAAKSVLFPLMRAWVRSTKRTTDEFYSNMLGNLNMSKMAAVGESTSKAIESGNVKDLNMAIMDGFFPMINDIDPSITKDVDKTFGGDKEKFLKAAEDYLENEAQGIRQEPNGAFEKYWEIAKDVYKSYGKSGKKPATETEAYFNAILGRKRGGPLELDLGTRLLALSEGMSSLGSTIGDSDAGRLFQSTFKYNRLNSTQGGRQTEQASDAYEEAIFNGRKAIEAIVKPMHDHDDLNIDKIADRLRKDAEAGGTIPDELEVMDAAKRAQTDGYLKIQEFLEHAAKTEGGADRVPFSWGALPDLGLMEEGLRGVHKALQDALDAEVASGIKTFALDDFLANYLPRRQNVLRHKKKSSQPGIYNVTHDGQKSRNRELKRIPLGTSGLNRISMHPNYISGYFGGEKPSKEMLDQAVELMLNGPMQEKIYDFGRLDYRQASIYEEHAKAIKEMSDNLAKGDKKRAWSEAEQELIDTMPRLQNIEDGALYPMDAEGLIKSAEAYQFNKEDAYALAERLGSLPADHVDKHIPWFDVNPIDLVMERTEKSYRAASAGEAIVDFLASRESLIGDGEGVFFHSGKFIPALSATKAEGYNRSLAQVLKETDGLNEETVAAMILDRSPHIDDINGVYIHDNAIKHIQSVLHPYVLGPKGTDNYEDIRQVFKWFNNMFRTNVTGTMPAFHGRNMIGGQWMNLVGGTFGPMTDPKTYSNMVRSAKSADKMYRGIDIDLSDLDGVPGFENMDNAARNEELARQAFRYKVISGDMGIVNDMDGISLDATTASLPGIKGEKSFVSTVSPLARHVGKAPEGSTFADNFKFWKTTGVGTDLRNPKSPLQKQDAFYLARWGRGVGSYAEGVNRLGPFISLVRQGYTPKRAAEIVKDLQADYSKLSVAERKLKTYAIPFYSFARRVSPVIYQDMIQRPGGPRSQLLRATRASRSDEPVPDHIQDSLAIEMMEKPDGTKSYLTGLGLPMEQALSFLSPLSGSPYEAIKPFGSMLSPAIKFPIEALTGVSTFQSGGYEQGRPIRELDPPIGRTIQNVKDLASGERTMRADPFLGKTFEHLAANSPIGRYTSTARKWTDPRKIDMDFASMAAHIADQLTGIKFYDVSPGAQDAILNQRLGEIVEQLGGRSFTGSYLPDYVKEKLTPEQLEMWERIEAEKRRMRSDSRARKEALQK